MRKWEEQLGLRLLNRTTRSVSPKDARNRLLTRIGSTLRELDSALDILAEDRDSPSGVLRINAGKGAARLLLRHIVPTCLARYPDVEFEMIDTPPSNAFVPADNQKAVPHRNVYARCELTILA